jgi:hypothetical protein
VPGAQTPGSDAAPKTPGETVPINAVRLAEEVVLDRLEALLTWLLTRLQRYRARRGDWWER